MKTGRRSWMRRIAAAVVVAAASPAALVAPKTWERVKDWRNGYLTEKQAERFIQCVLDESVLLPEAKVMKMPAVRFDNLTLGPREDEES